MRLVHLAELDTWDNHWINLPAGSALHTHQGCRGSAWVASFFELKAAANAPASSVGAVILELAV